MTPQACRLYAAYMAVLEELADELDRFGAIFARRCSESDTTPGREWGRRPLEMSPDLAKIARSRFDDELVRRLEDVGEVTAR